YLPRGIDQIAASLAAMRCGAAFAPIDAQTPPGRVEAIVADLRPQAVVVEAERGAALRPRLGAVDCRSAAAFAAADDGRWQEVAVSPSDLAYLIFTSGSTGVPKGVAIEHASICNFVDSLAQQLGLRAGMRCSHLFSPSFDGAIGEIFPVL